MADEQRTTEQPTAPEAPKPLEIDLGKQVTMGMPGRMQEAAAIVAAHNEDMSLGRWLEIADAVAHTGRVLFKVSPEADEFADFYKPKMTGDAGIDIYCIKDMDIPINRYIDIPSGIFIAMPHDWYAEVRARSSTSKRMIHVYPGIIDPSFRGEILACVTNFSTEPIAVKRGERIAQLVFHKRVEPTFLNIKDKDLPKSDRGDRGFGSTGK